MPTDNAEGRDDLGPGDTLSPSESLDSDEVRNDDGDVVVDPPDEWLDAEDSESLDERLAEEEPDTSVDTPLSEAAYTPEGVPSGEDVVKQTHVVEGVVVEDAGADRGQVDGAPEDGESFFPVVDE